MPPASPPLQTGDAGGAASQAKSHRSSLVIPQRWAVTGATGLVGNNLVRALLERGASVKVLVRGGKRRELEGLDVESVEGDLQDRAALDRCFDGADVVVHAAAMVWIGNRQREAIEAVNVGGTASVCAAVPRGTRLIHVSSVDALGWGTLVSPANEDVAPRPEEGGAPYVDSKRAADRVVRASGTDHVIVHPTLVFGPWDWRPTSGKLIRAIARGEGLLAPPSATNVVYVGDVVHGVLAAASAPSGRAYILGNENITWFDLWTHIAAVTGARPPLAQLPAFLGPIAVGAVGLLDRLRAEEAELNAAAVRMSFMAHCFDPSRARAELGLPATPVRDTLAAAWDWLRHQPT